MLSGWGGAVPPAGAEVAGGGVVAGWASPTGRNGTRSGGPSEILRPSSSQRPARPAGVVAGPGTCTPRKRAGSSLYSPPEESRGAARPVGAAMSGSVRPCPTVPRSGTGTFCRGIRSGPYTRGSDPRPRLPSRDLHPAQQTPSTSMSTPARPGPNRDRQIVFGLGLSNWSTPTVSALHPMVRAHPAAQVPFGGGRELAIAYLPRLSSLFPICDGPSIPLGCFPPPGGSYADRWYVSGKLCRLSSFRRSISSL